MFDQHQLLQLIRFQKVAMRSLMHSMTQYPQTDPIYKEVERAYSEARSMVEYLQSKLKGRSGT